MVIGVIFVGATVSLLAYFLPFLIVCEIFSNKMEALLNTMIPNQMLFISKNFFQTRNIAGKEKPPASQSYPGSIGEVSFYLIRHINSQNYFRTRTNLCKFIRIDIALMTF